MYIKRSLMIILLAGYCQLAQAATIVLPSLFEPNLIGAGGILDTEFGLGNLSRVDDANDQWWSGTGMMNVETIAKYAGFKQRFGIIDAADNVTRLLYVPTMAGQTASFDLTGSALPFRFGLKPSGSRAFTSAEQDNTGSFLWWRWTEDHMVTWAITGGQYAGDFVIAWEDLKGLGDRDYNDLVLRVSGVNPVPVPATAWLFISGLIGIAGIARRRTA